MSSRFWVLMFCMFGLLLVGMATLQGKVMLLVLPLMVYLVAAILNAPGRTKIQVERSLSARVVEQGFNASGPGEATKRWRRNRRGLLERNPTAGPGL